MTEVGGHDPTAGRLGSYQLEDALGDGVFGRRYRARHVALDSPRVVEVREPGGPGEDAWFLQEARTGAALEHANILTVLDFGTQGEVQYVVTDLVDSTTLADRLGHVPVSWRLRDPLVRRWIRDVAAGLDHARDAGVTGGDLRPASVLVETGTDRPLLTAFGDVRAFAALLREIATGDPSADGGTLLPGLDAVLANRYRTAGDLASAVLDAVPIGPPVAGLPPTPAAAPIEPAAPRLRPPPAAPTVAAAALALLVGAGILAGLVHAAQPEPGRPAAAYGALGAPVSVAGMTVSVLGVDAGATSPPALELAAGDRFLTVTVLCRAAEGAQVPVSPYDWVVSDAQGRVYGAVVDGIDSPLPERTLAAGQSVRGSVGFVVPRSAGGLQLHFDAELGSGSAQVPLP